MATFEGPLQAMMAIYYWAINGPLVVCLLGPFYLQPVKFAQILSMLLAFE